MARNQEKANVRVIVARRTSARAMRWRGRGRRETRADGGISARGWTETDEASRARVGAGNVQ